MIPPPSWGVLDLFSLIHSLIEAANYFLKLPDQKYYYNQSQYIILYSCCSCVYTIVHAAPVFILLYMLLLCLYYCTCCSCVYTIVHAAPVFILLYMMLLCLYYCTCCSCVYTIVHAAPVFILLYMLLLCLWTCSLMNVRNTPYLFHGLWIFISENLL